MEETTPLLQPKEGHAAGTQHALGCCRHHRGWMGAARRHTHQGNPADLLRRLNARDEVPGGGGCAAAGRERCGGRVGAGWSRGARFRHRGAARGCRASWWDVPAGGVTRGGARRGRAGKLRLEKLRAAERLGGGVPGLPVSPRRKGREAGATVQDATPREAA